MNTREIQIALLKAGHDPQGIDGIMGANTRAAIMAFQAAHGLEVDGIVGPVTSQALFGDAVISLPLPWMAEARRHLGMQEGTRTADRLMRMNTAAIPWCGAFVALCMSAMPVEPLPANPLWARNWMKFGRETGAAYGAVAVFRRGDGGHVGFVAGHDESALFILGGNQSNRVSIAKIAKNRLLGYRWPTKWPAPTEPMEFGTLAGALSTNEA